MKAADWINRLKYLVTNRVTYYDNSFPGNCGEINGDGSISFDCIGMVKSVINEPDIVVKTSPAGYYVQPGKVIPDTTEYGILELCSERSRLFSRITPGEYLYMSGHAGVYVGSFNGSYNVIECTPAFGGGVVASYVDAYGNRYDHKGGTQLMKWEEHGKLTPYIEYEDPKIWVKCWRLKDSKGVYLTGWQYVDGKWYYLNPKDSIMVTGWLYDDYYDGWFLLGSDGAMLTGWQYDVKDWYYLAPETTNSTVKGRMVTGWLKYKDNWYYLDKHKDNWYYLDKQSGKMYIGTHIIDGKTYYFDNNGALIE